MDEEDSAEPAGVEGDPAKEASRGEEKADASQKQSSQNYTSSEQTSSEQTSKEQTSAPILKEPCWPLILGSVVPLLAVAGYLYLLWNVIFGSLLPKIPNLEFLNKALTTLLIWFGVVNLVYSMISYVLDFVAVWAFVRRSFWRSLALAYSLRAWKLTGFLLSFAAVVYLIYSFQLWLASTVIVWIGLITSFLIAIFLGSAVIELAHKVTVSKRLFFTLMLTEFAAYAATIYVAIALFVLAPKWP